MHSQGEIPSSAIYRDEDTKTSPSTCVSAHPNNFHGYRYFKRDISIKISSINLAHVSLIQQYGGRTGSGILNRWVVDDVGNILFFFGLDIYTPYQVGL